MKHQDIQTQTTSIRQRLCAWISLCLLSCNLTATAQDSLLLRDYQFIKGSDPWLTGKNSAALTRYNRHSIMEAETYLSHSRGELTNYDGSPNVLEAGATIESVFRISPRTVVYGRMSYDNWTGRNMTGSAFMPLTAHRPFDIVEDSLTNPGRKHSDTYQLCGAVGIDLWKGISLGTRLEYVAANYAKYKDLRHSNKLMDLQLTAGLYAPLANGRLNIGANYYYHRTTESVTFSLYGREDRVFKSLISFGGFMGKVEQFGEMGYTDKSREMPLIDNYHGGSAQLEWNILPDLSLYNELMMAHREGYYGRKSPYTITYTNHHANLLAHRLVISTTRFPHARHALSATVNIENLVNNRENFRELKNDNGAYYYEYYTDVRTANRQWTDFSIDYTAHWGIRDELPTWTLEALYDWNRRKQTAYLYPYYRRQQLTTNQWTASLTRNIITQRGVWSLKISGSFQKGSGAPCEDGTMASPSDKQQFPATMEAMLMQEYRYLTAPQYHIGGCAKYAFILPSTRLKTHVRLAIDHHKANESNAYCSGNDRLQLSAAVGCTF